MRLRMIFGITLRIASARSGYFHFVPPVLFVDVGAITNKEVHQLEDALIAEGRGQVFVVLNPHRREALDFFDTLCPDFQNLLAIVSMED